MGLLEKLRKKLRRKDASVKAMTRCIEEGLANMCAQNLQTQEAAGMQLPLGNAPSHTEGAAGELAFLTRTAGEKHEQLGPLFTGQWRPYVKDYNVVAVLPAGPGREDASAYLAAVYDAPWAALQPEQIPDGVFETQAADFFEDAQALARRG